MCAIVRYIFLTTGGINEKESEFGLLNIVLDTCGIKHTCSDDPTGDERDWGWHQRHNSEKIQYHLVQSDFGAKLLLLFLGTLVCFDGDQFGLFLRNNAVLIDRLYEFRNAIISQNGIGYYTSITENIVFALPVYLYYEFNFGYNGNLSDRDASGRNRLGYSIQPTIKIGISKSVILSPFISIDTLSVYQDSTPTSFTIYYGLNWTYAW